MRPSDRYFLAFLLLLLITVTLLLFWLREDTTPHNEETAALQNAFNNAVIEKHCIQPHVAFSGYNSFVINRTMGEGGGKVVAPVGYFAAFADRTQRV